MATKQQERREEQERQERAYHQVCERYRETVKRMDNRSLFTLLFETLKRLNHGDRILLEEATQRAREWK